jgi:coatomer subunit beta'
MQLAINPIDPSMFASASLDKHIKIWTVGTTKTVTNYTLSYNEAGVNSIDFCRDEQKLNLVSGDDLGK